MLNEVLERRVQTLEQAEVEHGFAYIAENAWLLGFLESNRSETFGRYGYRVSDWFTENLNASSQKPI